MQQYLNSDVARAIQRDRVRKVQRPEQRAVRKPDRPPPLRRVKVGARRAARV